MGLDVLVLLFVVSWSVLVVGDASAGNAGAVFALVIGAAATIAVVM